MIFYSGVLYVQPAVCYRTQCSNKMVQYDENYKIKVVPKV